MPIDPNIILGIKQQPIVTQDPIDQYSKGLALKGLMGQQELQSMQLQQGRQGMEDENAVRSAYANAGGDNARLRALLQGGGQYKAIQALDKFDLEKREKEASIGQHLASTKKTELDAAVTQIERGASLLSGAKDQASYDMARRQMSILYPQVGSQWPAVYDPAEVQAKIRAGMTIVQNLADQRSREQQAETGRHNKVTEGSTAASQAETKRHNLVSEGQSEVVAAGHRSDLQGKENQRQGAIQSYDTAIGTLDRLVKHPGFSTSVGATMLPGMRFVPGTEAANFDSELTAFKSQTFLPMVQSLRGMGALSNAEGDKLTAAVGALNINMGEKAFKESAERIRNDLVGAKERFERQGPVTIPGAKPQGQSQQRDSLGGVLKRNADGSFDYGFSR